MRSPRIRAGRSLLFVPLLTLLGASAIPDSMAADPVTLPGAATVQGYVARLLINEVPFPGERGWVSEQDSKDAMLAILCVLDSRLKHIPPGYRQEHIAAQRCENVIEVITAGGEKGQCDGFYLDSAGKFVSVPRVEERIAYLMEFASKGKPGRFARLLQYGADIATAYVDKGVPGVDRFASLDRTGGQPVTGRAYGWMTDHESHHPGGNFVRIADDNDGALGGNRFFTLRKSQ